MELIVNDGWEERLARVVAKAEYGGSCCFDWADHLPCDFCLSRELSRDELDRVLFLCDMVDSLSHRMKLNMIKGVLKYGPADRPLSEWLECGLDDAVDAVNYFMLAREAQ